MAIMKCSWCGTLFINRDRRHVCCSKECGTKRHQETTNLWRKKNRAKINDRALVYRLKNKEKINDKQKEYRERSRDKRAEYDKMYAKNNPIKIQAKNKRYRESHKHDINNNREKYKGLYDYKKDVVMVGKVRYNINTCPEKIKPIIEGLIHSRKLKKLLKESRDGKK